MSLQRLWNKKLWKHHDLHLKSDTLVMADVFENFRKMCSEIYNLHSARFLSALGLVWQAALKKIKVELKLLVDIDKSLMVEKRITGGMCHSINRYGKGSNKYMKYLDKNKEFSYLKCWVINNLYGWTMSQKLLVYDFKWVEEFPKLNEGSIKSYNEKRKWGYFLEVDIQYTENLHKA